MSWLVYAGFIGLIFFLMILDLGLFHRKQHVIGMREAMTWTGVWVATALVFNGLVYFLYGHNWLDFVKAYKPDPAKTGMVAAQEFFTGYLVELSLSMDNLVVFAAILAHFGVPLKNQHRVLVWGIIGAVILRGGMIGGGVALVNTFEWMLYVFGGILILTSVKMAMPEGEETPPERRLIVRMARKVLPVTKEFHGSQFFAREGGRLMMTPMLLALLLVDVADVIFAVDSIPAIFGVTRDPFIIFTSNMFAILGLRSMYFALVNLIERFKYLKPAIVVLLAFIGVKLVIHKWLPIDNTVSLIVIGCVLLAGICGSLIATRGMGSEGAAEEGEEGEDEAKIAEEQAAEDA
ncbi:MAG TPA: TerC family protein [Phycisphaerales bacterium]|nr:TerC family protein [Phycisphaerales bacterium]